MHFYSILVFSIAAFAASPPPVPKKPPARPIIEWPVVAPTPPQPVVHPPPPVSMPVRPPPFAAPPSGGGSTPPPARPFFSPTPHVIEPPRLRPYLFYTRFDKGFRNGAIFKSNQNEAVREEVLLVSDTTLTLDTLKKEAKIDAVKAQHEHENDLLLIETNRELHEQVEALYKKDIIGKEEFEESKARLLRTQARADETKYRAEEYRVEMEIDELKLKKARGAAIPTSQFAKVYVRLWETRLGRAKAAEAQAAAVDYFLSFIYENRKQLQLRDAASKTEVIKARRDSEESAVVLRLARALIGEVEQDLAEAREAVSLAEAAENNPTPAPAGLPIDH